MYGSALTDGIAFGQSVHEYRRNTRCGKKMGTIEANVVKWLQRLREVRLFGTREEERKTNN